MGQLRDRVVNNNRHGAIKLKGAGKKPTKRMRREAKRPKKERAVQPTKTEWVLNTPFEKSLEVKWAFFSCLLAKKKKKKKK